MEPRRRCHIEGCPEPPTRDTPLCFDHWQSVPEGIRRAFMNMSRAVVRAAQEAAA